jgi:UDPglucose 6-dehydrogenase/GDP-mannose 6-dehydrogenase
VAFKPGTDDIRESPALPVIQTLLDEQADVRAFDPTAREEAEKVLKHSVTFVDDVEQAVTGVDAVLIMTRWDHFREVPRLIERQANPPLVVDGRRMLDKHSVPRYEGIGL